MPCVNETEGTPKIRKEAKGQEKPEENRNQRDTKGEAKINRKPRETKESQNWQPELVVLFATFRRRPQMSAGGPSSGCTAS